MSKNLPYNKTVVSELKVTLADLVQRTVVLKSSVAAPIPVNDAFNSGDATLSSSNSLTIPGANSIVLLSSFQDFEVVIDQRVLLCRGLFLHNGTIPQIVVRAPADTPNVRLHYLYS